MRAPIPLPSTSRSASVPSASGPSATGPSPSGAASGVQQPGAQQSGARSAALTEEIAAATRIYVESLPRKIAAIRDALEAGTREVLRDASVGRQIADGLAPQAGEASGPQSAPGAVANRASRPDFATSTFASGSLDEAQKLAHRLRGTAGCYGFRDVGQVAGEVEDAIGVGQFSEAFAAIERLADLAAKMTSQQTSAQVDDPPVSGETR